MAREVSIVTPENVTITYELAGLGSRALAHFLDLLIQATAIFLLLVTTMLILSRVASLDLNSSVIGFFSDFAIAIVIILVFITLTGYFTYFETLRNGQTPGKRWMGLRVITEEGSPIDLSSAVVRNLVRIIEFALGVYLVGIISIVVSRKYKRIGDYAAGTIVVKERAPSTVAPEARQVPTPKSNVPEASFVQDTDLLTHEELDAVRRFVLRKSELPAQVHESVARQIAEPIMSRLNIPQPQGPFSYASFLEEIYMQSWQRI